MSCFICSDRHISALAAYGFRPPSRGENSPFIPKTAEEERLSDAELAARRLHEMNVRAYQARYDDAEAIAPLRFDRSSTALALTLPAVEIIKAAQCYRYQASDARDWEGSAEQKFIEHIIAEAITHLPGYGAAPWGIRGE